MVLLGYALQTQLNTSMLSNIPVGELALQLQNNPIKPSILVMLVMWQATLKLRQSQDKLRQSQDMHIVYLCFALQAIGVCGACPKDLRMHA